MHKLSPMNFLLHHQCRVIVTVCVRFSQSFFPNIFSLLLQITKKADFVFLSFKNKYTRQIKLFFSPWQISLRKVNAKGLSQNCHIWSRK